MRAEGAARALRLTDEFVSILAQHIRVPVGPRPLTSRYHDEGLCNEGNGRNDTSFR
jgi:hypothetical protein